MKIIFSTKINELMKTETNNELDTKQSCVSPVIGSPNYKPIIFSGEMVNAILEGRKTQTRRIIKPQPDFDTAWKNLVNHGALIAEALMNGLEAPATEVPEIVVSDYWLGVRSKNGFGTGVCCPNVAVPFHYQDLLWVRETYQQEVEYTENEFSTGWNSNGKYVYRADGYGLPKDSVAFGKWKPSIFMVKAACRIFLYVKSVRVERLQDISEADAIAEGANHGRYLGLGQIGGSIREGYFELWERINGKDSVLENPWVWVIEFIEIERPTGFL